MNNTNQSSSDVADLIVDIETPNSPTKEPEVKRNHFNFFSPSELLKQPFPRENLLAGDMHITKGSPFIIGGAPGVGKSRAITSLALAGAMGTSWMGIKIMRRFRTMILQAENGLYRLQSEYEQLPKEAENWIRISTPPSYGFAFDMPDFIEQLSKAIAEFKPDVFILDPWTRLSKGDGREDYIDAYGKLLSALPKGNELPAIGIVAHTRKPQAKERANGRELMHTIAGSFAIAGIARSVFVMQSASDNTVDKKIVFTCCKNNDGELGASTAWEMTRKGFNFLPDFDMTAFREEKRSGGKINLEDIIEIFKAGDLKKSEATEALEERTGAKHSACYKALSMDGRFGKCLIENKEMGTVGYRNSAKTSFVRSSTSPKEGGKVETPIVKKSPSGSTR